MKLSETVSYGVLAGTSFYCVCKLDQPDINYPLALIAYGCTGVSALLSIVESDIDNEAVYKISNWTRNIRDISFPLLVGHLWMRNQTELYIGYAHPLGVVLLDALGPDVFDMNESNAKLLGDTVNEISCAYLGYIKDNQDALLGALTFFLTTLANRSQDSNQIEFMCCGLSLTFYFMLKATIFSSCMFLNSEQCRALFGLIESFQRLKSSLKWKGTDLAALVELPVPR